MWKSYALAALCGLAIAACATTNPSPSGQAQIERQAANTIADMEYKQPQIRAILQNAYAYAVFPSIGKGGFIVGGAYGKGVLYEQGRPTGFVDMKQASLGAQIGGQTFAELVVLPNPAAVQRLKAGQLSLGADISAVVFTIGSQGAAQLTGNETVFVMPHGGLMAGVSVTGQQISYLSSAG